MFHMQHTSFILSKIVPVKICFFLQGYIIQFILVFDDSLR